MAHICPAALRRGAPSHKPSHATKLYSVITTPTICRATRPVTDGRNDQRQTRVQPAYILRLRVRRAESLVFEPCYYVVAMGLSVYKEHDDALRRDLSL